MDDEYKLTLGQGRYIERMITFIENLSKITDIREYMDMEERLESSLNRQKEKTNSNSYWAEKLNELRLKLNFGRVRMAACTLTHPNDSGLIKMLEMVA